MLDIHDDYWINLRYRCYQFRRPFLKPIALWNVYVRFQRNKTGTHYALL